MLFLPQGLAPDALRIIKKMIKKKRFLIGGILVVLAIAYLAYTGFGSSARYYLTVSELAAQKDSLKHQSLRVSGEVVNGSVEQNTDSGTLRFAIIDVEKKGDRLPVVYHGIVPNTFKAGRQVVVEGRLDDSGVFQANKILTKCPSKYKPKE